jgi:hypothetical protein
MGIWWDPTRFVSCRVCSNGLAGAGFTAIGYERGLPGYRALMDDFRAGEVDRSEAPSP